MIYHSNLEEFQKHSAEPKLSDTGPYTTLFYLHNVHEQPNYFLVTEIRMVVAMEGRQTGEDVRKLSG